MWIYLIQFIILFLVAYLCYIAMGFISDKTNKNKKEIKKQMAEVALFVKLYNINLKKVSYKKISRVLYLILSFDLALTVFFAVNVDINIILKIALGILLLGLLTIVSYRILGFYYKKKGMTKNV